MMTDVHGGYPAVCNAGDARPVHHTAAHLLGQAVLALFGTVSALNNALGTGADTCGLEHAEAFDRKMDEPIT